MLAKISESIFRCKPLHKRRTRAVNAAILVPDSMDLYFQGLSWFNKGRYAENMLEARGFFERALALDPGNLDPLLGTAAVDMQVVAGYQTDDRPVRFAAVEATDLGLSHSSRRARQSRQRDAPCPSPTERREA
jgi:hypothetical protein